MQTQVTVNFSIYSITFLVYFKVNIKMEKVSYDDINSAFNNLSLNHSIIKETTNSENESPDPVLSTFKPIVSNAIDILREKKEAPRRGLYLQTHNKNTSFTTRTNFRLRVLSQVL